MLQFAMALGALTAMLTLASAQTDTDGRVEITFQKAGRSGGSGYLFYQGQKYGLAIAGPEIKRIWATSIDVAYPHLADASRAAAELVLSGRASHVPDDATTVALGGAATVACSWPLRKLISTFKEILEMRRNSIRTKCNYSVYETFITAFVCIDANRNDAAVPDQGPVSPRRAYSHIKSATIPDRRVARKTYAAFSRSGWDGAGSAAGAIDLIARTYANFL
jgi:hypothetical protein